MDRRDFLAKAGVGTAAAGALWAVPSVAGFDAAFAGASCARTGIVDWDTYSVGTVWASQFFAAAGSHPALTVSTAGPAVQAGTPTAGADNGQVAAPTFGGIAERYYILRMTCNAAGEGFNVTFTFSTAVWNLRFSILDIDRSDQGGTTGWQDLVWVTQTGAGPAFTFTGPGTAPNTVTGLGTNGNRWTGNGGTNIPDTSTNGNANLIFAGPVTSVTIRYVSGDRLDVAQRIGISDLTFCR